jgi:hypothetical protein
MAGQKFWAHGTTVTFDSVQLEGIVSIELPDETTGEVTTTDGDSGGAAEFLPGIRDQGSVTIEMRRVPGATGQASLRTARENETVAEMVITAPAKATTDSLVYTIVFDCYVSALGGALALVDEEAAAFSSTFRVTGDVTETVA